MNDRKYKYNHTPMSAILAVRDGEDEGAANAAAASAAAAVKAETDALIAAAVADQVKGLKAKNEELLAAQRTMKEKYAGIDPEKVKELQVRLDADEDVKLLAEGKKAVVIEKYTERMRAAHQAELEAERAKTQKESQRADAYKGSVLDNQIRSVTSGLHKGAVEDALLLARGIFSLDATGRAVKLNSEGVPELGKDGSTPFSPAEWMEQQKEMKPHWFPNSSSGSGSGEARPGQGGQGKTITRAAFEKLQPMEQAATMRSGTKLIDQ
jgi:hypothetical protein